MGSCRGAVLSVSTRLKMKAKLFALLSLVATVLPNPAPPTEDIGEDYFGGLLDNPNLIDQVIENVNIAEAINVDLNDPQQMKSLLKTAAKWFEPTEAERQAAFAFIDKNIDDISGDETKYPLYTKIANQIAQPGGLKKFKFILDLLNGKN